MDDILLLTGDRIAPVKPVEEKVRMLETNGQGDEATRSGTTDESHIRRAIVTAIDEVLLPTATYLRYLGIAAHRRVNSFVFKHGKELWKRDCVPGLLGKTHPHQICRRLPLAQDIGAYRWNCHTNECVHIK